MLDIINRIKANKPVSRSQAVVRVRATDNDEWKVVMRTRWASWRKNGKLAPEWDTFDKFWTWFEEQPVPVGGLAIVCQNADLARDTPLGPDTAVLIASGANDFLLEKGLIPADDVPLGVRRAATTIPSWSYSLPGSSKRKRAKDPMDAHMDWLRHRIAHCAVLKNDHEHNKGVHQLLDRYAAAMQASVDSGTQYYLGQWRA